MKSNNVIITQVFRSFMGAPHVLKTLNIGNENRTSISYDGTDINSLGIRWDLFGNQGYPAGIFFAGIYHTECSGCAR